MANRAEIRTKRVNELIEGFEDYLHAFERSVPFTRAGQWERHADTIQLRRSLGSVVAALSGDRFVESLWNTLLAWGIGVRGSRLLPLADFGEELRRRRAQIAALDRISLQTAGSREREQVWELIQLLGIVDNKAKLVALTKTLHHLLPDLVVPIDRRYTGTFFGWNVAEFQTSQRQIFDVAWQAFVRIARAAQPERYVGDGWNTGATKVIDNAIVGYCNVEGLGDSVKRQPRAARSGLLTSSRPRRESWTINDLTADLEVFEKELRAAGLKENTVAMYVGRTRAFLRWLAGQYKPRRPNE